MRTPFSRPRRAALAAVALGFLLTVDPAVEPSPRAQTAGAPSYLLVLNKAEATLAIIDPATMQVVGRVPTGDGPHEVATSADGRTAYVANYGGQQQPGHTLSVIDLAARKETRRVDLGPLLRPHGIAERGGKIYFTSELARAVGRYDPATDKVDLIVGVGQNITHMLVLHPRRPVVYTANMLSNTASVIELDQPQQPGPPPRITHIPVGPVPEGIDVTPDGRELWVGHNQDGGVSIIDTETHKVKETIKVGGMPIRIKFTPDGKYALVSSPQTGELTVLDAATRREVKRLMVGTPPQGQPATGAAPIGILVAPDGRRAYVAVTMVGKPDPGKVVRIDLEKLEVAGSVETGQAPDGLGWVGK